MQVDEIKALLNEAKSLNAQMGKVATPCFKCLWEDPGPNCIDNDWHRHDTINKKITAALEMLDETHYLGK
jgi:hypothetical protein